MVMVLMRMTIVMMLMLMRMMMFLFFHYNESMFQRSAFYHSAFSVFYSIGDNKCIGVYLFYFGIKLAYFQARYYGIKNIHMTCRTAFTVTAFALVNSYASAQYINNH